MRRKLNIVIILILTFSPPHNLDYTLSNYFINKEYTNLFLVLQVVFKWR
jgi:hypothetical protein